MGGHHQWVLATHLVHRLSNVCLADLLKLVVLPDPVLDHRVPAGGDEDTLAIQTEGTHILHWSLMSARILRLDVRLIWVPNFNHVVRTGDKDRIWHGRQLLLGRCASKHPVRWLLLLDWLSLQVAHSEDRYLRLGQRYRLELRRAVDGLRGSHRSG